MDAKYLSEEKHLKSDFATDRPKREFIRYCGYCLKSTPHQNDICQKCGSDNTRIQGFSANLM